MKRAVRVALVVFALFAQGCGTVLQFAVGWDEEEKIKKSETRSVQITSAPPGATVIRRGGATGDVTLGQTPLTDSHAIEVEETVETPQTWAIWAGCVAEAVGGVAIAVAQGGGSGSNTTDPFESDFSTEENTDTLSVVGGFLILGAIVDLVVGIVQSTGSPTVSKRDVIAGKAEYQYIARADGLPEASQKINVPDMSSAHLVLDPKYIASTQQQTQPTQPVETQKPAVTGTPGSSSKNAVVAGANWVIAVMNVEDANKEQRDRALDPGLVRNLGDQIRVFVAQQGVRTIDRSSQDRALKEQIDAVKSDSYKSCYDDSCQIELGKALAASHILRTRVARFGKRCVLNGELIDLKAEVTMAAASSQGDCGEEGFLNMGEEVAKNLVRVQ